MMSKGQMKPDWASQELRLDPSQLPQVITYAVDAEKADVTFTISQRGAVIRQVLPSNGLPMSVALPISAFSGIAARAVEDEYGLITVTLELLHEDTQLSVPLLVAHDLNDIAADWRAWAAAFNLPMMMVEEDGIARPLYENKASASRTAQQSRVQNQTKPKMSQQAGTQRRPRFLARRKSGTLGLRMVIAGCEIITKV